MGEHNVEPFADEKKLQSFMKALLEDLSALACMLDQGRIESILLFSLVEKQTLK